MYTENEPFRECENRVNRDDLISKYGDDDLMFLDPPEIFDKCILGVSESIASPIQICYSVDKIISALEEDMNIDRDVAMEHFEFNILGSYMGDNTPRFVYT